MSYINADLLNAKIYEKYDPSDNDDIHIGIGIVQDLLNEMPAADVAEVVRCKDCKYYKESIHFAPDKMCYKYKDDKGHKIGYIKSDNDFCSYGERKETE